MLQNDLEPTPIFLRSDLKELEFAKPRSPKFRTLSIYINVLRWAWDMIALGLTFNLSVRARGAATRELMERLGYLWVKLGQILSLRKDFLSTEFCDELVALQHNTTCAPMGYVISHLQNEFGKPLSDIFSSFTEKPIAAASIAQVHKATLKSCQTPVVVKIMRPRTKEFFEADLKVIKRTVGLLNWLGLWTHMRWDDALWEIQHMMMEESDFRFEAANLKSYRKSLEDHDVYVPHVFPELSTETVLVLEHIPGVLLSDFNAAYHLDPARVDYWCKENNFDRKKAGLDLLLSFSRQLFEDNFYHADLHPGNILLLRNSKVALIDIGSAGTVEADLLRRFFSTVRALATQDYYKTADLMISFCPKVPAVDLTEVTEELVRCLRDWEVKAPVENIPFHDKTATYVLLQMVELMTFRYRLPIGWSFLKITRSWCNLESSVDCLNPKFNSLEGFRRYFAERDQRLIQAFFKPTNLRSIAVAIPDTLNEYRLFVEPRVRKASRVMQLSLKRTDQIIVGCARLLTKVISFTLCYLLFLLVILYSLEGGRRPAGFIRQVLPERTSDHFLQVSNRYATWVNRKFGEPLSQGRSWLWFVVPIVILFQLRRGIRRFAGKTENSDVNPFT